jgi:sugar fermentation stimulation protein A
MVGEFVSRPNRFIAEVHVAGKTMHAHCPNPGRMRELLLPGTRVYLEDSTSPGRKTSCTLVAAEHGGHIVPLHTSRTNQIARELILPRLFEVESTFRHEVTYGSSRLDFAVDTSEGTTLIEVKSCSLCEHGVAMFPDAPTTRGIKHLNEINNIVTKGDYDGAVILHGIVLFVIGYPDPRCFVPNVHTDPDFAISLKKISAKTEIRACATSTSPDGYITVTDAEVPIDYSPVALAEKDGGVYLLILHLKKEQVISTGALGNSVYRPGWYVYAGSAARGLSQRLARHVRKSKKIHWHIDYLSSQTDTITTIPIRTDNDLECGLAESVRIAGGIGIPHFGSSDCRCPSHLFYYSRDPWTARGFVKTVFSFRHREGLDGYLNPSFSRLKR